MKKIHVSLKFIQKKKIDRDTHTQRSRKWKGSCEKQNQKCIRVLK